MYPERIEYYKELERLRESKVIILFMGDRPGLETRIAGELYGMFVQHLDKIGIVPKITLYLYTRGGETLVAWSLVNLIRQFCKELEVIVPSKAHSAGTLIALGADRIIMTKQATLGPIDPSVNNPLNPAFNNGAHQEQVAVSVEAIRGYIDLAKIEFGLTDQSVLASILLKLSDQVHPIVLGEVYRASSQIQMLARRLLGAQKLSEDKIKAIINFLCSDSGSHDYTITRREARDSLGLIVDSPDNILYGVIKHIYDDISDEINIDSRFNPSVIIGDEQRKEYVLTQALLESLENGSHRLASEGVLAKIKSQQSNQYKIEDTRRFSGWRHQKSAL